MLYKYPTYRPKKEGYYSLYQKEVRDYISNIQINQMKKNIKNFLLRKLNNVSILNLTEKLGFSNLKNMKT
jgi:hypothetical protein